jgi:dihydrofolate synthase/folylpolyglutamate synthase
METLARYRTLSEWLRWQDSLHHRTIDLGLDRLRPVADRLGLAAPAPLVISVAGTNGKGSSVAILEAVLEAAGYRVGSYTSPHLLRYNERIRVDGSAVGDETLCDAFARIDSARADTTLTSFEFGTLAALYLFERQALDAVILEVGLGGRLDAVNLVDADVALITAIGIDHSEWLGSDRNSIGREKAGIFRTGRAAVVADPDPPPDLLRHGEQLGVALSLRGRDFGYRRTGGGWLWWGGDQELRDLPLPLMPGEHQLSNAAGALAVLRHPGLNLGIPLPALRSGLASARVAGRFQILPGAVTRILDVAHNPDGAGSLARGLRDLAAAGTTRAVVGMLAGKDTGSVFGIMDEVVDHWYLAGLPGPRGQDGQQLHTVLRAVCADARAQTCADVAAAYRQAMLDSRDGDRVVVFGSFLTVAAVMAQRV